MKVELFLDFDDILYLVCASRLENTLCEPTTLFCVSIGVIVFIHKCVCICVFVFIHKCVCICVFVFITKCV